MGKKIGIIVQRYGKQINGGAESHARMIAEKLSVQFEMTVLTSCAINYHSWESELSEGESYEGNIRILRFKSDRIMSRKEDAYLSRKIRERHLPQKFYRWLGKPKWWYKIFPQAEVTKMDYQKWLETQGPYTPGLIDYLKQNEEEYVAFIFFTAVYFPAAVGVMEFPEKSILVPLMHDEPVAYFPVFRAVMASPRWILFNTYAEQRFCEKLYPIQLTNKKIVAVGIDIPDDTIDKDVLAAFKIDKPYIIYLGRIDVQKGCDTLLLYFQNFLDSISADMQLVFVGKDAMNIKPSQSIILTGFISDKDKEQLLKQAEALVVPSAYESLSLALLESFACKIPVIANGKTEVLKDHIDKSGGGWCYENEEDFINIMNEINQNKEEKILKGKKGYQYVTSNYTWENVLKVYDEAIKDVEENSTLLIENKS